MSDPEGLYKIGTLARLSGLGVATIRNWERRYQLLVPERTEGGHRLYTESDRVILQRARKLSEAGRSIGEIAALVRGSSPDLGSTVPRNESWRKGGGVVRAAARARRGTPKPTNEEIDGALARCVLDALPHGLVITDVHGRTEWINEAVTDLCGYTLAQLKGRTPGSVLQGPGTDRHAVRRITAALAARRPCTERLLNYDSRNRAYMAAIHIAPLSVAERHRGFVGLIRDLTRDGPQRA